jgi:hypothetical protein
VTAALATGALLAASAAQAFPTQGTFNIYFDDYAISGTNNWSGTFSTDSAGLVTSFAATIGSCGVDCDYTLPQTMHWNGTSFVAGAQAQTIHLDKLTFAVLEASKWNTVNIVDSTKIRDGAYLVTEAAAVLPEPATMTLFLLALAAIFLVRRRQNQLVPALARRAHVG